MSDSPWIALFSDTADKLYAAGTMAAGASDVASDQPTAEAGQVSKENKR